MSLTLVKKRNGSSAQNICYGDAYCVMVIVRGKELSD